MYLNRLIFPKVGYPRHQRQYRKIPEYIPTCVHLYIVELKSYDTSLIRGCFVQAVDDESGLGLKSFQKIYGIEILASCTGHHSTYKQILSYFILVSSKFLVRMREKPYLHASVLYMKKNYEEKTFPSLAFRPFQV